ncbi:TrmH family RNA methyltransferase [Paenactinomyces guangxiensis]|uniref:RNA methyltransferase n=1 Tax=Paenactinomyces guangxiensis TaxID=1490290 RepID=A0A7W1WRB5_9BACL|nr:RNA methyltransferase [Paenactinomyces guangxiensis]MBA4494542.1 RNA methyltransferase [Paenactinomyces guangxiensis]MBH8591696.1 RNA methyltransferase [Paenactinomyces guangxiensis]
MDRFIPITSLKNEQLKKWKKLQSKKGRAAYQSLLIEGEHLISEALKAGVSFRNLIVDAANKEKAMQILSGLPVQVPIYELTPSLFASVAETDTPQGIAAVIEMPVWSTEELLQDQDQPATYLVLDSIQDPGNLGTIIRTAEAAGVKGLWLGKGTVDPFNSKVVRAAMGSLFRLPMLGMDLQQALPLLKESGVTIVGTSPRAGMYHFQYPFPARSAVLLGNEGRGVDPAFASFIDAEIQIPMPGRTESLNVSITSAVLLYERLRQQYPHM